MAAPPANLSRRDFLRTLAGTALLAGSPDWLQAGAEMVTVSILHTTDLHGHLLPTVNTQGERDVGGLARCASQIRAWRRANPNCLLLDIGDVYQGTHFGWQSRGRTMIDCLNALEYDAWVLGNHELDWGLEPLRDAVARSRMPVLAANCRSTASLTADIGLAPYILREVAGFRIGIIGATTPGMDAWLPVPLRQGLDFSDPVPAVRTALRELRGLRADAVILAAHMGHREDGDDFANRIGAITAACPELTCVIGGHTHRLWPSLRRNGVMYTQANHFGTHVGRVDLGFDANSRRLLSVIPRTMRMDSTVPQDAALLSRVAGQLEESERALAVEIGRLSQPLQTEGGTGRPSAMEESLAAAMREALSRSGVPTDAVLHGLYDKNQGLSAGPCLVRDIWRVVPYESLIATVDLTREQIVQVFDEVLSSTREAADRNLVGLRVQLDQSGSPLKVAALSLPDGQPLAEGRRYRLACSSFDAQSGGRRLMRLATFAQDPASNYQLHPMQVREALAAYVQAHFAAKDPAPTGT